MQFEVLQRVSDETSKVCDRGFQHQGLNSGRVPARRSSSNGVLAWKIFASFSGSWGVAANCVWDNFNFRGCALGNLQMLDLLENGFILYYFYIERRNRILGSQTLGTMSFNSSSGLPLLDPISIAQASPDSGPLAGISPEIIFSLSPCYDCTSPAFSTLPNSRVIISMDPTVAGSHFLII